MSEEELKELEKSEEEKGFKWTNLEQVFEIINEQHSRITRAIEYIEQTRNTLLLSYPPKEALDIDKLLDILKGNDSNE